MSGVITIFENMKEGTKSLICFNVLVFLLVFISAFVFDFLFFAEEYMEEKQETLIDGNR